MIELPTYTSLFRLRRRLYAIYDWELPVPIGLFEAGVFIAVALLFVLLGQVLGIRLTAGSAWFYLVPPGFAAHLARKPVADRKEPHAWALGQLRYLLEPRVLHRLAETRAPSEVTVSVATWQPRRRTR